MAPAAYFVPSAPSHHGQGRCRVAIGEAQARPKQNNLRVSRVYGANVWFKRIYIEHVIHCAFGDCAMIAESTYDTS